MGSSTNPGDSSHSGSQTSEEMARWPDDQTLIARGKYSTLRKDKRQQLERIQAICTTLITVTQRTLTECQAKVQDAPQNIVTLANCVENLSKARDAVIALNGGMAELENEAWPK